LVENGDLRPASAQNGTRRTDATFEGKIENENCFEEKLVELLEAAFLMLRRRAITVY
jgi:hypothetical protein